MENLKSLKEQVPSRCYYYLLDWNDSDNKKTLWENFNVMSLSDLSVEQFWCLFKIATEKEILK